MLRGSDVTYTMTCVFRRDYHLGHIVEPLSKFCTHPRPGALHVHPMAKVTPRPQYIFQLPQISGTPEITETRDKVWRASEVGEESHMGTFSGSLSSRVGTVGRIYRGPQEASGRRWDGPAVAFTEGCLKDHKPEQELSGRGARRRSAFPQRVCPLGTRWLLSLAFPGLS